MSKWVLVSRNLESRVSKFILVAEERRKICKNQVLLLLPHWLEILFPCGLPKLNRPCSAGTGVFLGRERVGGRAEEVGRAC